MKFKVYQVFRLPTKNEKGKTLDGIFPTREKAEDWLKTYDPKNRDNYKILINVVVFVNTQTDDLIKSGYEVQV